MRLAASCVVVAFGVLLIVAAAVVFGRPAIAERCLAWFASSARAHYTEQIVRLLIGAALVVLSPTMWQAGMFRLVGWVIVVSSAVLICAPWQWHYQFGKRLRPILVRYLRIYAAASFAFGALLLYGVFMGGGVA